MVFLADKYILYHPFELVIFYFEHIMLTVKLLKTVLRLIPWIGT